ncbi:MAG: ubiquitin-like domain-containing protein [Anaerolineae bacterium]
MASESLTLVRRATVPRWLRGLLALGLVAGALALLALGLSRSGVPLTVDVDGQRHQVRTHAATVGLALRHAGIDLYDQDLVRPALDTAVEPGLVVWVQRATPATIRADGHTHQLRTQATTIGGLLAQAGVGVGPGDEIWLGQERVWLDSSLAATAASERQLSARGGGRAAVAEDPAAAAAPLLVIRRAASLTLDDGGQATTLHTTAATVAQVLQEHGVHLYLGDAISPSLQSPVQPDLVVSIQRSVPVQIQADGRTLHTRTRAEIVAGLLGQEGIALVGRDRVEPSLWDRVQAGMTVRVTRVREELLVEFEAIPFATIWVPDPELEIDQQRLAQAGQVGLNKRRYRIVYEDGREVERYLEDSWAEQPPITKTLAYGTKIVVRTLETPDGPIEYWRKIRVYTTSYKPSSAGKPKDHPRYGYTRLGQKLRKGLVAVDPTVIPLKTWMYVPGYGLAKANDTGGGVKGKFVDLGYEDHNYVSWHWWTDIYLLTPVPPASQIRWILPDWPKYPDRRR